ncbi:hypothetical protein RRG08_062852 [Elysia crispata]|uniref:Uncharacterized protein n=1 Tax=Elysia crispata TaxID=231223 RepID=A0AAE0Z9I2_9GAST|nr:hypothetical protein RRG08_062852 [Elysia crispata]
MFVSAFGLLSGILLQITLGGRGEGRLTQNVIRRLFIYFTRAVQSNNTSSEMRDAIMASVYHMFSTDEKPQDQLYPKGPSSWCFYNAAEAKDDVPGPHSIFRHTSSDENLLQEHILPVYRCLTDDALLKRCERHATQNPNESLHNVIWAKHKFYSKKRIELSTVLSISEFNPGPLQMIEIREVLGLDIAAPLPQYQHFLYCSLFTPRFDLLNDVEMKTAVHRFLREAAKLSCPVEQRNTLLCHHVTQKVGQTQIVMAGTNEVNKGYFRLFGILICLR